MQHLPRRAQGFISVILLVGSCIGGTALAGTITLVRSGPWGAANWAQIVCIVVAIALLQHFQTPLPTGSGVQTLGTVGHLAAVIIFPLPLALVCSASGLLVQQVYVRWAEMRKSFAMPAIKTLTNVSLTLLSVGITASVLAACGGSDALFAVSHITPLSLLVITIISVLYYGVNVGLFATFSAYLHRRSPFYVFRVNYRSSIVPETVAIFIGVIAGLLWRYYPPLLILSAVPVLITHYSYRSIRRLEEETVAAVTALAESIDVRDPYTAQHSQRVSALCHLLALQVGLADDKVEQVTLAAHVHDLGKMAVPVEILGKDGPLTPDERCTMEQHSRVGAEVLSRYKGFGSSVPLVLHHHERWDGQGYPQGLAGEAIPVGARIIALADTFDAMTTDRPYRKGRSPDEALRLMAGWGGTQFDPDLTSSFVRMLTPDHFDSMLDPSGHLALSGQEEVAPSTGSRATTTPMSAIGV